MRYLTLRIRIFIILISVLIFTILGCQNSKNGNTAVDNELSKLAMKKDTIYEGEKLMKISCNICHSPTASEIDRLAPPMIAVKRRYLLDYPSKDAFTKGMQEFLKNPTDENAIMYGAVKRFGVMPKAAYPDETIQQIAEYIYDNTIEQPEWFEEHYNQNSNKRTMMKKKYGLKKNVKN